MFSSKRVIAFGAAIFIFALLSGQELRISDLVKICSQANWSEVNQILMSKGWEYHTSENNKNGYSTITWSYNKSYNNEANAWIWLYVYENNPAEVIYSVFNKPSYDIINNNLSAAGFKVEDSRIGDNEIYSKYFSTNYILEVTITSREKDSYSQSISAYRFDLTKKNSIFDPDNGIKRINYDDGTYEEYSLKDGKRSGNVTSYYRNGQVELTGNYRNGLKNGQFIEYDEDGDKIAEYFMYNDKVHGKVKTFEDDKVISEFSKVNGVDHGKFIRYYYDDEELYMTYEGNIDQGAMEGRWSHYLWNEGEKEEIEFTTYRSGKKNGPFKEYTADNDTVMLGNYSNGEYDGLIKMRVSTELLMQNEDGRYESSNHWYDAFEGEYENGIKHGHWITYTMFGKLSEGNYLRGKKEGEWKVYVPFGTYAGRVFYEEIYIDDELNGEQRFYYSTIDDRELEDSSKVWDYYPVDVRNTYKEGIMEGPAVAYDSSGVLIFKGFYSNGEKDGEWIESYLEGNSSNPGVRVYQEGRYQSGDRHGKWLQYINKDNPIQEMTYNLGNLHGDLEVYQGHRIIEQVRKYEFDNLKTIQNYDSTGTYVIDEYEILNENPNSCLLRYITYSDIRDVSQVYEWLIKDREDAISDYWFDLSFQIRLASPNDKSIRTAGEYVEYDKVRNIRTTGNIKSNSKEGFWTVTYLNEGIEEQIVYENNEPKKLMYYNYKDNNLDGLYSGIFIRGDESGELLEEISIKNGLRHGLTRFLDSNGKVVEKQKYNRGVLVK